MKTYSEELKSSVITQRLPPRSRSVAELVKETGIPKETLYTWRSKALGQKEKEVAQQSRGREGLSSAEKFHRVVESAALNEQEKGEFCRRRGIFPEQLSVWRESCLAANEVRPRREEQAERRELLKENRQLQGELRRKEKALAEAAALLMLQKKVRARWEAPADASSAWPSDGR